MEISPKFWKFLQKISLFFQKIYLRFTGILDFYFPKFEKIIHCFPEFADKRCELIPSANAALFVSNVFNKTYVELDSEAGVADPYQNHTFRESKVLF